MDSSIKASASALRPEHALARLRISPVVSDKGQKSQISKETPRLDTSTLAAHDFDVDVRSGFMPPEPPIDRLPTEWKQWDIILQDALRARLKIGEKPDITPDELERSQRWRDSVQNVRSSLRTRLMCLMYLIDVNPGHRETEKLRKTPSKGTSRSGRYFAYIRAYTAPKSRTHPNTSSDYGPSPRRFL